MPALPSGLLWISLACYRDIALLLAWRTRILRPWTAESVPPCSSQHSCNCELEDRGNYLLVQLSTLVDRSQPMDSHPHTQTD